MRTILDVLYVALYLILTIPLMIAEWIIGHFNQEAKDRSSLAIVQWGFRCVTIISGVKVTTIGEENVPKDRSVLYIGNHRSFFDIILTYSRVPNPTGYIAKKEIRKVPLLHIWMQNVHCLFMDRSDIKAGLKTILTAIDDVKKGISIFIFPEGTRNKTEADVLPFRDGSFKVATKSGCPIIPVTITNSRSILEDHFPWVRAGHVTIEYGKPIETASLSKEELRNLPGYVSNVIAETYRKNKQ